MGRRTKNESLTEEEKIEIKARVVIGEDPNDLALEFNISPSMINILMKEEPSKTEAYMQELIKHRPEVIESVIDNLPDISDQDADTIESAVHKLQKLDDKTMETGLLIAKKLHNIVEAIDVDNDAAAFAKLASTTGTLMQIRTGFFKQGTIVQVGGQISQNNLTLIKNGGKV